MNNKQKAALQLLFSIIRMIEFFLLVVLFVWSIRLRQLCSCAVSHTLTVMQVSMGLMLACTFYDGLNAVMIPVIAVYLFSTYMYVKDLDTKPDCECPGKDAKKTLEVLAIVQAIIFFLVLTGYLLIQVYAVKQGSPLKWRTASSPLTVTYSN